MNKRVVIVFIAFFVVVVGTALVVSRKPQPSPLSPTPTPYSLPTVNSWEGITPGSSTENDVTRLLGQPSSTTQETTGTIYSYPSTNQYWKNEVTVTNNTVSFIRERVFAPSNTSLKGLTAKLAEKPTTLYGPDHMSGTFLYVYPGEGVAFLANSFRDTVYQIWRFPATTAEGFLSLPQAAGYGASPTGQPEGI